MTSGTNKEVELNPDSAKVKELFRVDRRVAIDDFAKRLEISHRSAAEIVRELDFAKICARWVPRNLRTPTSKRVSILDFLHLSSILGTHFLIVL